MTGPVVVKLKRTEKSGVLITVLSSLLEVLTTTQRSGTKRRLRTSWSSSLCRPLLFKTSTGEGVLVDFWKMVLQFLVWFSALSRLLVINVGFSGLNFLGKKL